MILLAFSRYYERERDYRRTATRDLARGRRKRVSADAHNFQKNK